MAYLLFPGRHLILTKFQEEYLWEILRLPATKLNLIGDKKWADNDKLTSIVFAVTSFNQSHSRYNPIPFSERAINIDRFMRPFKESIGIGYNIVGIPHFNPTDKFVEYTIKEISERTEYDLKINPDNTIVLCSTPALIEQYRALGFSILTAEYDFESQIFNQDTPIELLKKIVEKGEDWMQDDEIKTKLSKSTYDMWQDFSYVPKTVLRLWRDPLMTDSGSLTLERNYSSYAYDMNNQSLMKIKFNDIKDGIISGKIVDEGCSDGALIVHLAEAFPDSDIIGIELTSEFTARCEERLRAGEFGGTYVHFHQRNLLDKIFEDSSIDTTICNSTTHELWSYGNQAESLSGYLKKKYNQTTRGGRIIIRDVVGPSNKDSEVYMKLNKEDGRNEDIFEPCTNREQRKEYLSGLSTHARFLRFAKDYLADMRANGRRDKSSEIKFKIETVGDIEYVVLRLKDAVEFMTKKDYVDNWSSELNEEFAYWDFEEWKNALREVGFSVIENNDEKQLSSRTYVNDWIVNTRWEGKVELFENTEGGLKKMEYPPTHMVLIGEKN